MRGAGRRKKRKKIREIFFKHKKKKQRLLETRCQKQRHASHWLSVALVAMVRQRQNKEPFPGNGSACGTARYRIP